MTWVNAVVQGVLLGGLFALFATGLSLAFGVMRFVNLAHGDLALWCVPAIVGGNVPVECRRAVPRHNCTPRRDVGAPRLAEDSGDPARRHGEQATGPGRP